MNRYLLFGGSQYYATGGFNDYVGSFCAVSEAIEAASTRRQLDSRPWPGDPPREPLTEPVYEWWQVVDTRAWEIVARSQYQAYGAGDDVPLSTEDTVVVSGNL